MRAGFVSAAATNACPSAAVNESARTLRSVMILAASLLCSRAADFTLAGAPHFAVEEMRSANGLERSLAALKLR